MKKERLFHYLDFFVYFFIGIMFLFFWVSNINADKNWSVYLLFFIIGTVSFFSFCFDKRYISVNKLIMVYVFFFLSIAPTIQYGSDTSFWGLQAFDDSYYIRGCLIVVLFLIGYELGFFYKMNNKAKKKLFKQFILSNIACIGLTCSALLAFLFLLYTKQIFVNSSSSDVDSSTDSIYIFFRNFIRFIPVVSLMLIKESSSKNQTKVFRYIMIAINFLIALLIFFPIGGNTNRYQLFGVYIIMIFLFFNKGKLNSSLLVLVCLGIIFLFPSLNFFKYHNFSDISSFTFSIVNFKENDYDSFYVIMTCIKYVDNNGILWGRNLFSALLALIPRSLWNSKMLPSGQYITTYYDASFSNVSCPVPGEFYLSFGSLGVFLLSFGCSFIISKVESKDNSDSCLLKSIDMIFGGLCISVMRGSLLPTLSFFYTFCICFLFFLIISQFLSIPKFRRKQYARC